MAWTPADLANIEQAIRDLVAGNKRTVTLTLHDRIVSYERTSLTELRALRDEMKEEVNAAAGASASQQRPRIMRSRFSKGL
jgi:hypothetical protein